MKLLLIPDKFKGSLRATEVIAAISKGIDMAQPDAHIQAIVASDGGDGFLEAVSKYTSAMEIVTATVDPLGRAIRTVYLYDSDAHTAYIELAKASGMVLLNTEERSPLQSSTYGTGLQIMHAISAGAKQIYIGLGGSATNDGGIGIAKAFGFNFIDITGKALRPIGANLERIDRIQPPEISKMLKGIRIYAVNDVSNPLCGPKGAAKSYAQQKGADQKEIAFLDAGLMHLDEVVKHQFKISHANTPGAGAAGGTAYGLKTFAGAHFISGIDFILQLAGVANLLQDETFDFIITGEGQIDEQTMQGKLINGILTLGKQHNIPVVAICGSLEVDKNLLYEQGLYEVLEVRDPNKSLEDNMKNASALVTAAVYDFIKEK